MRFVVRFELTDYFDYFVIEDEMVEGVAFVVVVVIVVVLIFEVEVELEFEVGEELVMKLV